jgi:hypothetical protein
MSGARYLKPQMSARLPSPILYAFVSCQKLKVRGNDYQKRRGRGDRGGERSIHKDEHVNALMVLANVKLKKTCMTCSCPLVSYEITG